MQFKNFKNLLNLTKTVNSQFKISSITQALVDAIGSEIAQSDMVGFFIKNEENLYVGYSTNKHDQNLGGLDITQLSINPDEDEFVKNILNTGNSDYIPDTRKDQRADKTKTEILKITSILGIPMFVEDEVFGLIFAHNFGKPMSLTETQREATEAYVDMASVAIRKILSFDKTRILLEKTVQERTIQLQQANHTLEDHVTELNNSNNLKNDFIASLSHELRTPITAIKGSLDILKLGILGELNQSQIDLISTSANSVNRLLKQVNDILDFAKLENEKIELNYTDNKIDEVLTEAITMMEVLLDKKNQKIILDVNVSDLVSFDRVRILQVVINLLSNSNKFTLPDGEITVKAFVENHNLIIEVKDTGVGIPNNCKKHIFTKFYQVNNQLNGTGLGLFICKHLVEMHEGKIWFDSEESVQSLFSFSLPIQK